MTAERAAPVTALDTADGDAHLSMHPVEALLFAYHLRPAKFANACTAAGKCSNGTWPNTGTPPCEFS